MLYSAKPFKSTNLGKKIVTAGVCIFAFISLKAQAPVAAFTPSVTSGCAILPVVFTDNSTGSPTSWHWDFINNTNPALNTSLDGVQNPFKTLDAGVWTVKLTVQNGSGTSSASQTITAFAAPTAAFDPSNASGCYPLKVQFTDKSTSPTSGITKWEWIFGDGNTSTEQNPSYVYKSAGTLTASLKVTNAAGCFDFSNPATITINGGVKASYTTTTSQSCKPPATVTFTNTSQEYGNVSYLWDFGDGTTDNSKNPSPHTYNTVNSYTVKLIAQSDQGCIDTLVQNNQINIVNNVTSNFSISTPACSNNNVTFTNTSVPQPFTATWSFADGTASINGVPTVTHSFTNSGSYQVKVINNFGTCIDSITKPITIVSGIVPGFDATKILNCQSPVTVDFKDTSAGSPTTWLWNFGDGQTSASQNPSITYTGQGNYTVSLTATNAAGCSNTVTKFSYIKISVPNVGISIPVTGGCSMLDINATAIVTNNVDGIQSYTWDFGDGSSPFISTSSPLVTHHYGTLGTFTLKLTVLTNSGCSISRTTTIKVGSKPTLVNFTADNTNPCAGSIVTFKDLSTPQKPNPNPGNLPGIDQWIWNFGDGSSTSSLQNPTHKYTDDNGGTGYTVKLIAYNSGCADSVSKTAFINVKPPVAKFTANINCNNKKQFLITPKISPGSTVTWDFGDGTTSTNPNLTSHTFPDYNTTYNVKLTAINGGCTNIADPVTLLTLSVDSSFTFTPSSPVCRRANIAFTPNSDVSSTKSYLWDFGDGQTSAGRNPTKAYTSNNNYGDFTVKLTVTDTNGCSSSTTKPLSVKGIAPNFSLNRSNGCIGTSITVANTSVIPAGASPIWLWDFGNGTTSSTPVPPNSTTYSYDKQGNYAVKLKVTDGGCTDSLSRTIIITQPYADFSADTASCPGAVVQFTDKSAGNSLKYSWSFGANATPVPPSTTTSQNPSVLYAGNMSVPVGGTTRAVKLTVTDANNCQKDTTHIIRFDKPSISFTPTTATTNCPPLVLNFKPNPHFVSSYNWDFGDGTNSAVDSPAHTYFYANPAGYTVTVTVTSPGGCTATASSQPIKVFGPSGNFSFNPKAACKDSTIKFTVANTNGVGKYIWDYNDGAPSITTTVPNSSHKYTVRGNYIPRVILINPDSSCLIPIPAPGDPNQDTLKIIGIDPKFSLSQILLCDTATVTFTNTSQTNGTINSIVWDFGDGSPTSTTDPVSHFYTWNSNSRISYSVKMSITTSEAVCTQSVTYKDTIVAYQSPQISIKSDKDFCEAAPAVFQATLENAMNFPPITWQWDFGNGQTANVQNPAAQSYSTAGSYTVKARATNSKGCVGEADSTITIHPLPPTNAGVDSLICYGQSVQLTATGADTYQWISPSTPTLSCTSCASPIATPTAKTDYVVAGTTTFGCTKNDTVTIAVNFPVQVLVNPDKDSLCIGQSVQLKAAGAATYTWSPANGLSSTSISNPVAKPDTSTIYRVIGTDSKACFFDTAFVNIAVFKYPAIELGPDASIPSGTSYQINGTGSNDIVSINWKPSTGLSCINCLNPVASPERTTNYTAIATNNGNCSVADNINIIVFCNEQNFFMPNTFSPNNDGMNDVFYPRGKGLAGIQSLRIYNRLGQKVFEKQNFMANDPSAGWNGIINGEKAPQDVYVYIIEFVCSNSNVVSYKGNVSLIR